MESGERNVQLHLLVQLQRMTIQQMHLDYLDQEPHVHQRDDRLLVQVQLLKPERSRQEKTHNFLFSCLF